MRSKLSAPLKPGCFAAVLACLKASLNKSHRLCACIILGAFMCLALYNARS